MYRERQAVFEQAVARLRAEGGADYDGVDCNPDCVLKVRVF